MALSIKLEPYATRGPGLAMDPYRPGEDERRCEQCGEVFVPASRTQRFCKACGKLRRKNRHRRA